MTTFSIGNVVKLKSGGPKMTIYRIFHNHDSKDCQCIWFAGNTLKTGLFTFNELKISV